MNKFFKIVLASTALVFGMMAGTPSADALTLNEIVTMAGQGLSDDVLITIISSADSIPTLSEKDYHTLKSAGISDRVIQAIETKNKPEPPVNLPGSDTNAPADTVPESANGSSDDTTQPPSEGTPETSTEQTTSQQAVGDNTILAPLESSNIPQVFRKFFVDAYETYSVQAEIARRTAKIQNQTEQERADNSELPKVLDYIDMIGEHSVSALESCLAMMDSVKPAVDTPLHAYLHECIGLALNDLKAPSMGAIYLDIALQSKAKLVDYSNIFQTFMDAAHAADYMSSAPLLIKPHYEEVDEAARPAFLYFMGYSLVFGQSPDVKLARQLLNYIPESSEYYAKARILLAALDVRAPDFKFKQAASNLTNAIKALENNKSSDAFEQSNLAWLSLARIAYENRAFDMADEFYRQVDVNSHHLRDALLENAWGQLFAGNYGHVLSITHALRAPIFRHAWLPDLLIIESSAYLGLCRYEMAAKTIETFRSTTLADADALMSYIAETPSRDFYNQVIQYATSPSDSRLPDSAYRRVINDPEFRHLHRTIRHLSDERRELSKASGPSFTSWPMLQDVYDKSIGIHQQRMSTTIAGIYEKTLTELHTLDISASQIAIEIKLAERKREAECLKIVAAGGKCESPNVAETSATIQKRETDAYWNFDGEFWRDEIHSYVSGVTSMCPDK